MPKKIILTLRATRAGTKPEIYFSPSGEIEVICSNDQREAFERETGADLRADVLSADEFRALTVWLTENAGLKTAQIVAR